MISCWAVDSIPNMMMRFEKYDCSSIFILDLLFIQLSKITLFLRNTDIRKTWIKTCALYIILWLVYFFETRTK